MEGKLEAREDGEWSFPTDKQIQEKRINHFLRTCPFHLQQRYGMMTYWLMAAVPL